MAKKKTASSKKTVKKAAAKKAASKSTAKRARRAAAAPKPAPKKSAAKKSTAKKKASSRRKAAPSNEIRLPKMQAAWFDAGRSLDGNSLLKNQVEHFLELERGFPEELRSGLTLESIQTEGQAADYIRRVTLLLHRYSKPQAQGG